MTRHFERPSDSAHDDAHEGFGTVFWPVLLIAFWAAVFLLHHFGVR